MNKQAIVRLARAKNVLTRPVHGADGIKKAVLGFITLSLFLACAESYGAKPAIFEDIHYYVTDRAATGVFLKEHFGARLMAHPGRPISFIDFWALRPGEVPLTISPIGPFPGSKMRAYWEEREIIPASPQNKPYYGVIAVGIATPNLDEAIARMTANGVKLAEKQILIPNEPNTRSQTIFGPDYNFFNIVERPNMRPGYGGFGVDYVHLLVKDKDETKQFFEQVYFGETTWSDGQNVVMDIIGMRFILSEPGSLGWHRKDVEERDAGQKIRFGVDHIAWLSTDIDAFVAHVGQTRYQFSLTPIRYTQFGEKTVYRFGYLLNPDGLQTEIMQEDGRSGARSVFVNSHDLPEPPWKVME